MSSHAVVPLEFDAEDERALAQEELIVGATEVICELLEREGVSRQELAERLGKTKGFVSQVLNGERNMTLRTLADLAHVLGHRLRVAADLSATSSGSASPQLTAAEAFGTLRYCFGATQSARRRELTETIGQHVVQRHKAAAEDDDGWREKAQRIAQEVA
jgi:Helix-turn-helix.